MFFLSIRNYLKRLIELSAVIISSHISPSHITELHELMWCTFDEYFLISQFKISSKTSYVYAMLYKFFDSSFPVMPFAMAPEWVLSLSLHISLSRFDKSLMFPLITFVV